MGGRYGTRYVCVWRGLTPAIVSGVSGGSIGSALPSFCLASCFCTCSIKGNSLSSHSRFSNLRIIERSFAALPCL